jgi:hypothetical protein
MCWSITSASFSGGAGFASTGSELSAIDLMSSTVITAGVANSAVGSVSATGGIQHLVKTRRASIFVPTSSNAPTATGMILLDGGIYASAPAPILNTSGALITQTTTVSLSMGGATGTSYISS